LQPDWVNLIRSDALCAGDAAEITFQEQELLVFRTASGAPGAISAYCPHTHTYIPNGLAVGVPISELVRGEHLVCPFHGWRFDNNGCSAGIPAATMPPKKVEPGDPITRSWELQEVEGWIQIVR
jgi:phenylpropionate dioxygenase-like ring-hydroxylating dioxygenase large terminal subunit